MEALMTILFLAVGSRLLVLTIRRLKDIKLSNRQSGMLTPHLDGALRNGDASAIVTLCHNYEDSSLGRIVKAVIARADAVAGPDGVRSEALRLLIDQAARREVDRVRRGLVALRAIAVTSAPIGVIAGGMVANSATSTTELSDAFIYGAEGFILSMIAVIAYKYLQTKADAEAEAVAELCDHLHGVLLLRRQESWPPQEPTTPTASPR
jgi:biopolymer transport protein ExbB/TolQ